jgi:hypothetical protein
MPEEMEIGEVGVDKVGESAQEAGEREGGRAPWLRWLALSTAVFAVVAALGSLRSGHFANESLLSASEATLRQAQASDQWAYYQAKGLKSLARESEAEVLAALHAAPDELARVRGEAQKQKSEQAEIQVEARKLEDEQKKLSAESTRDLDRHQRLAYAVTMLQVAIGLSAVAALIERRSIWLFALLLGAGGMVAFALEVMV